MGVEPKDCLTTKEGINHRKEFKSIEVRCWIRKNREKRLCPGWLPSNKGIVVVLLHFIIQQLSTNIFFLVIITQPALPDMIFSA